MVTWLGDEEVFRPIASRGVRHPLLMRYLVTRKRQSAFRLDPIPWEPRLNGLFLQVIFCLGHVLSFRGPSDAPVPQWIGLQLVARTLLNYQYVLGST